MTPEESRRVAGWFAAHPAVRRAVLALNRWLPAVPFVCYPALLVLLNARLVLLLRAGQSAAAMAYMPVVARAILVPGITFGVGTALRARLNRPRPYEQPGFVPLAAKARRGHSFPSRHALSAAVLAVVWFYFFPAVGVGMALVAAAICVLRVLTGLHFVRDVAAGAALGFVCGAVGMWL